MSKTLSISFVSLFGLVALLPLVSAHGFLSQISIDGQVYKGNVPNNYAGPSPIRLIDDVSPVKGAANPNLSCGQNAVAAELVATANPGSSVAFSWDSGEGGSWPHNVGPLLTYMAQCTGTTCDKFDASQAKWFKIDQVGKEANSDTWVVKDTLFSGKPYELTLPTNIVPGDYLIRHEILALHLGDSPNGAEFYPSCTQVRIDGTGTGGPKPSELVSFPGAYSDSDSGIFDPTVFNPGANYTSFPGPNIAAFVASAGAEAPQSATALPQTASPTSPSQVEPPASTASPDSDDGYSSCNMKRMVKRHVRVSRLH